MNTRTYLALATMSASALLVGCDQSKDPVPASSTTPSSSQADNTARNKADRDANTKTPMDQSNNKDDIKVTADIRRAIMDDKSMSVNAQNCKIITDKSGVVTLRGPVNSQAEKDAIAAKAQAIAGVTRVVNELEVKNN